MVSKRRQTGPVPEPFDIDEFERERNAELRAKYTPEEIDAMHARAAAQVTAEELREADEIAARFFEELKDGRVLRRASKARRRSAT